MKMINTNNLIEINKNKTNCIILFHFKSIAFVANIRQNLSPNSDFEPRSTKNLLLTGLRRYAKKFND